MVTLYEQGEGGCSGGAEEPPRRLHPPQEADQRDGAPPSTHQGGVIP